MGIKIKTTALWCRTFCEMTAWSRKNNKVKFADRKKLGDCKVGRTGLGKCQIVEFGISGVGFSGCATITWYFLVTTKCSFIIISERGYDSTNCHYGCIDRLNCGRRRCPYYNNDSLVLCVQTISNHKQ